MSKRSNHRSKSTEVPLLVRVDDVARMLCMCERTVWQRVIDEKGFPQPARYGRLRMWRRADIEAYVEHRHMAESEVARLPPAPTRKAFERGGGGGFSRGSNAP